MQVTLFCDESGPKGRATLSETYPGEAGVFAGILIPEHQLERTTAALNSIVFGYRSAEKLRIADLSAEQQQEMRSRLFAYLHAERIACVYEAIHVEGFRSAFSSEKQMISDLRAARNSPVQIGRNEQPPDLHSELFSGLFGKAVAFCADYDEGGCSLKVIVDRVDAPILARFRAVAAELIGPGDQESRVVTGFDPRTRSVVRSTVTATTTIPAALELPSIQYTIDTVSSDTGPMVAADVLANSLCHLFSQRSPAEAGQPLNTPRAVCDHVLKDNFVGLWSNPRGLYFADSAYMHPAERARIGRVS